MTSLFSRRLIKQMTLTALVAGLTLCYPSLNTQLQSTAQAAPSAKKASKPIKRLLTAIRYQKDDLALASFDGDAQGAMIFGEEWSKQSPEERARFVKTLHAFFTVAAFPKIRKEYFAHLETILYGEPEMLSEGGARVRATIVVLHALKKDEIPVDFSLHQVNGKWLIRDFSINPDPKAPTSFITGLRDKQIQPLLKKKGWDGLITTMEQRVEKLKQRQEK